MNSICLMKNKQTVKLITAITATIILFFLTSCSDKNPVMQDSVNEETPEEKMFTLVDTNFYTMDFRRVYENVIEIINPVNGQISIEPVYNNSVGSITIVTFVSYSLMSCKSATDAWRYLLQETVSCRNRTH